MESKSNWFKSRLNELQNDFDFRLEKIILDVTEKISIRMKQKKLSRVKFAEKLKVSPPAVTKILDGNSNFTLRTLLSLADALELNLKIDFQERITIVPAGIETASTYTTLPANSCAVVGNQANAIAYGNSGFEKAA